jgi:hypothetical protein
LKYLLQKKARNQLKISFIPRNFPQKTDKKDNEPKKFGPKLIFPKISVRQQPLIFITSADPNRGHF